MWEDFYNQGPSDFDIAVEEFKEQLRKTVKEEILKEMSRLKKENEELQDVKKNFEQIKQDYERKKKHFEDEEHNLTYTLARKKINELIELADLHQECYYIDTVYGYVPKCDKCDERRKIYFKSPSGRNCEEECPVCGKYWCKYVVKPIPSIRLRFDNDPNIKCEVIYTWHDNWRDSTSYTNKNIYNGTIDGFDIKTYNRYHTVFSSKELAEQVCDKLNKDAGVPDNLEIKE